MGAALMHYMDRREDQRAQITLPIEIKTPQGTIKGKTANISIGGLTLLLNQESPKIDDEFKINLILRDNHEAELLCKKRWSGKKVIDSTVYHAIGARFIKE